MSLVNRVVNRLQRGVRSRVARLASVPWLMARTAGGLVCPFYHVVRETPPAWWGGRYPFKTPAEFEREIDQWLAWGPAVTPEALLAWRRGSGPRPRGFLLTFDDGYREMAEIIAPILKRKGVPAIFFITSRFVDNAQPFSEDVLGLITDVISRRPAVAEAVLRCHGVTLAQLWQARNPRHPAIPDLCAALEIDAAAWVRAEQPYLTADQIRGLIRDGFAIGAHSIDHPLYADLTPAEQEHQTRQSMGFMVEHFGLEHRLFAFPYGEFGVARDFCTDLVAAGVVDMFFGTRGVMVDDREPAVLQRLWCEDHTDPLPQHVHRHLARAWAARRDSRVKVESGR